MFRSTGRTPARYWLRDGELAVRFVQAGFDVTGIDLSDDMLAIAREKADEQKLSIPLYQQDMRELDGIGLFQTAVIFAIHLII